MKLVDEVLPRSEYDNDLLTDTVTLPVTPELGLADPRRSTARARPASRSRWFSNRRHRMAMPARSA
jgi:electron transport complex protein RnfG